MTINELLLEARCRIKDGTIAKSTKLELEQYATALSTPGASDLFPNNFEQACELIRLLLSVQISEESNKEATRISKIALCVAALALIVTVIQTIATIWPLYHPKSSGEEPPDQKVGEQNQTMRKPKQK